MTDRQWQTQDPPKHNDVHRTKQLRRTHGTAPARHGTTRHGPAQHGPARPGPAWPGTTRTHGTHARHALGGGGSGEGTVLDIWVNGWHEIDP